MAAASDVLRIIREVYGNGGGAIPLHSPVFPGNESAYVQETIASTYVSSVGTFVDRFERMLEEFTGARCAVATVNGTTALQMSLILVGVTPGDLVITQSLSFAATSNAIAHAGAAPAFIDVDRDTLGLSPDALRDFLEGACERLSGACIHKETRRRVAACVPMHTFGHPCDIEEIMLICSQWNVPVVEDAAEALGSSRDGRHCGTIGQVGTLSFNGNKICTTGGGGAILTNDIELGRRAKHLTTTAKRPHAWRFSHDEIGYNFRLPNINAALGCAQMESLPDFLAFKRNLANRYSERFAELSLSFVLEPSGTKSNYWLCALLLNNEMERDAVLTITNDDGVMTRPVWDPLHTLPMYRASPCGPLSVTLDIASRLVNIPSGVKV